MIPPLSKPAIPPLSLPKAPLPATSIATAFIEKDTRPAAAAEATVEEEEEKEEQTKSLAAAFLVHDGEPISTNNPLNASLGMVDPEEDRSPVRERTLAAAFLSKEEETEAGDGNAPSLAASFLSTVKDEDEPNPSEAIISSSLNASFDRNRNPLNASLMSTGSSITDLGASMESMGANPMWSMEGGESSHLFGVAMSHKAGMADLGSASYEEGATTCSRGGRGRGGR